MTSYKKSPRRRRKISWAKITLLSLVAFICLFFVGKGAVAFRLSVWDGQSRVNLIIDAGNIYLVSFDPREKNLLAVSIPQNTYVEAPYGFGFYPFGTVYDLGEIEKRGGEVLVSAAQEFFAIPIDGWLKIQSGKFEIKDKQSAKKDILGFFQKNLNPFEKEGTLRTNLTIFDIVRIWWEVKEVRFDKITYLNLQESDVLSDFAPSEGTSAPKPNLASLDHLLAPLLVDGEIREESFKVEVLNSTGREGLGSRVTRLITNLGGTVITLGNQENKLDRCLIKFKKEDSGKKTIKRLKRIFSCQLEEGDLSESRADLIFIIGEDYWQKLSGGKR